MDQLPDGSFCVIDGSAGIYLAQRFVQRCASFIVKGVTEDDAEILEQGPDHPNYFEVWEDVAKNIVLRLDKKLYTLHEESDLFAVPVPEQVNPASDV